MFRNYFKYSWRRLLSDKRITFIHLAGLAIGIAGFLLIVQYVMYERSYDSFFENKDRIYRVGLEVYRDNKLSIRSAINYAGVGPALKTDYHEVEQFGRLLISESMIQIGTHRFREEKSFFADSGFFQIFSIPFIEGNRFTSLREPNSVVIAASVAKKYFGTTDCIGQRLHGENAYAERNEYVVTGVFDDLPQNTHLVGKIFFSFTTLTSRPDFILDWQWRDYYTYVLLRQNSNSKSFEQKITQSDFVDDHNPEFLRRNMKHALMLQPVTGIFLYSDLNHELTATGNGNLLKYLLLIGIFVLGMAWVNYLNLSTAMAIKRLKEIGIRKTIGAARKNLVIQFLVEAFLMNALAFVIAVGIVSAMEPSFAAFIGEQMSVPFSVWISLAATLVLGALLSVAYPASVLSGFSPLKALKEEKLSASRSGLLRKSLIVFQFTVSIILIIGTVVVVLQLQHMQKADPGFKMDQTLVLRAQVPADSTAYANYLVFKNRLSQNPSIKSVTASHVVPGDEEHWTPAIRKLSETGSVVNSYTISANAVEPGFLEDYEIPVKYGHTLLKEFGSDHHALILTEAACKKFNFDDPEKALNQRFLFMNDTFHVTGITGDFRHYSMKYAPEPYVFFQKPDEYRKYSVKIAGTDVASTIDFVKKTYEQTFPSSTFEYVFLDNLFGLQYASEKKFGVIASLFTAMAIFIACLGLFGLIVFISQQRIKEIGIRKVLGASVTSIIKLLSADFLLLILIASTIAFPIAWWAMNTWLQDFNYRINISWWIFLVAGVLAMVIGLMTIGTQAMKAAIVNPVKSLRTE